MRNILMKVWGVNYDVETMVTTNGLVIWKRCMLVEQPLIYGANIVRVYVRMYVHMYAF